MGERSSVSFKGSDGEESPAVYSSWGGLSLPSSALQFARDLAEAKKDSDGRWPLDRLEPDVVILEFIRKGLDAGMITTEGTWRIRQQGSDTFADTWGHYVIDLATDPPSCPKLDEVRSKVTGHNISVLHISGGAGRGPCLVRDTAAAQVPAE